MLCKLFLRSCTLGENDCGSGGWRRCCFSRRSARSGCCWSGARRGSSSAGNARRWLAGRTVPPCVWRCWESWPPPNPESYLSGYADALCRLRPRPLGSGGRHAPLPLHRASDNRARLRLLFGGGTAPQSHPGERRGHAAGDGGLLARSAAALLGAGAAPGGGALSERLGRVPDLRLPPARPQQSLPERRGGGLSRPAAGRRQPPADRPRPRPAADPGVLPPPVRGGGRDALVAPPPGRGPGRAHPLLGRSAVAYLGAVRICGGHRGSRPLRLEGGLPLFRAAAARGARPL